MSDNIGRYAWQPTGFIAGMSWRLQMWGWSLAYVFLAVPAVVLFSVLITSLSVAIVGVGMLLLLAFVPMTAKFADLHRIIAGHILDTRIERPYVRPHSYKPLMLLRCWATDPARWRDFGWTFMTITIGWILSWLAFGIGVGVVFYAVYPFLYAVTPAGIFDVNYGIFQIDSQASSYAQWVLALVAFALWWGLSHRLVCWRAHLDRVMLGISREQLERRVREVSRTRAETLDQSAAELRRVEQDLHDGPQARLVSLGMSLGMAEHLLHSDRQAAGRLLTEARQSTSTALEDLRSVVRGIHPPVLSDRGLVGAVHALALDMAIPVSVDAELPGRPPVTVESALYFAIAECLANVAKHSGAGSATVTMAFDEEMLRAEVDDDGRGGAAATGTGLAGISRRLVAFDGTMDVSSPEGGPTLVTMEVPCELS